MILSTKFLLLSSALLALLSMAQAKTAVVFGATGTVGNEVLRAVANEEYFTEIIVVGRREFPPKVTDLLPDNAVKIIHKDLGTIDQHEGLAEMHADACFVAAASGFPHLSDMHDWHYAEVVMAKSIARVCGKMNTTTITIFTAVSGGEANEFSEEELVKTGTPMGWWPVMTETIRMMRLKEIAVILASMGTIPSIRIFRPSNIITKDNRYGWLDWVLFKIHGVVDEWLPTEYHSVTTELLAESMVKDAVNVLSGKTEIFDVDQKGAVRLDYGDFLTILGKGKEKETTEL